MAVSTDILGDGRGPGGVRQRVHRGTLAFPVGWRDVVEPMTP
jgi:hypothetical protein